MNDYGRRIQDALHVIKCYQLEAHSPSLHEKARLDILSIISDARNMGAYDYAYFSDQLNRIDDDEPVLTMMQWTRLHPMDTSL